MSDYFFKALLSMCDCPPAVQVGVVFCRGCGFADKFHELEKRINCEFKCSGKVKVIGEQTKCETGAFEVSVNGNKVHSKKCGEGFPDTEAKLDKILCAIRSAIK